VTPEDFLVKAEMKREDTKDKGKVHTSEFVSNNLFRAIHFPKKVNPDKVKVELRNGILYVTAEIARTRSRGRSKLLWHSLATAARRTVDHDGSAVSEVPSGAACSDSCRSRCR
jgi:hypothetical protein